MVHARMPPKPDPDFREELVFFEENKHKWDEDDVVVISGRNLIYRSRSESEAAAAVFSVPGPTLLQRVGPVVYRIYMDVV